MLVCDATCSLRFLGSVFALVGICILVLLDLLFLECTLNLVLRGLLSDFSWFSLYVFDLRVFEFDDYWLCVLGL